MAKKTQKARQVIVSLRRGWVAQDRDGSVFWYKIKPKWHEDVGYFWSVDEHWCLISPALTRAQVRWLFANKFGKDRIVRVS